MAPEILDFLNEKRTGVIAVEMLDGSPHAATVHFAYIKDPLTFIVLTTEGYRKLEPLRKGSTRASFVVGTVEEDDQKTLQLDGIAELADTKVIREAYFKKFPSKSDTDAEDIFFTFKPTWWRYTHWAKNGKKILTSTD